MKALAAALLGSLALACPAGAVDTRGLTVVVSATPGVALFGDPIAVDVHVVSDADPSSVRLEADAAPLERIGAVRRDVSQDDVHFRFVVACASAECLGDDALVRVQPAAMRVVGQFGDKEIASTHAWPQIAVGRRVAPAALVGQPRFAVDDRLAPVEWAIPPGRLAAALLFLALACAGAAAAVAAAALLRRSGRSPDRGDALARALAELRAALRSDERARRRAAGRVARVAAPRDAALASAAARLAWSEAPPEPDELEALAARVTEAAR